MCIGMIIVISFSIKFWILPYWKKLTRSAVSVRMVLAPQFCISVRGITSRAREIALYGHW